MQEVCLYIVCRRMSKDLHRRLSRIEYLLVGICITYHHCYSKFEDIIEGKGRLSRLTV